MIRIGDLIVGLWFDRSYQRLRVEFIGADYTVVRNDDGYPCIITADEYPPEKLWDYCSRNPARNDPEE